MKHRASVKFWHYYRLLPSEIRQLADENFALLRRDARHPSLRFKKVGINWSARVGSHYRAVAVQEGSDMVWVWIGHHKVYDQLKKRW